MRLEQQEIKLSFDGNGINNIVEQGTEVMKKVNKNITNFSNKMKKKQVSRAKKQGDNPINNDTND